MFTISITYNTFARYCCRSEKKSAPSVADGLSVQDTKPVSANKDHVIAPQQLPTARVASPVASSTIDCRPIDSSSPSKRLSPADVSGTNEEWETASEGSDGGVHPRRQTTHREDATTFPTVKCSSDSVKPVVEPDTCGRSVNNIAHHSPCASGVPSLTDLEHSWKETSSYQYHRPDVGNSVIQHDLSAMGSTNTDSADVAVNQSSSSLPPGSRLFAVSFSDPGSKQPPIHDTLVRFVFTRMSLSPRVAPDFGSGISEIRPFFPNPAPAKFLAGFGGRLCSWSAFS